MNLEQIELPCNQCVGCRMDRALDWSTRITHEAMLHYNNCFLTLTYSDEHLPADYSVSVRTMQLFMKRFRKYMGECRFFACGEYGDGNLRPHYHVIIFGIDFDDKYPWRKTGSGHLVYRSPSLEKIWTLGHSEIGTVTEKSAGYVARYCLKKVNGDPAEDHYKRVHPVTGEIVSVAPEFINMSRKPGLGGAWYDAFRCDAFPSDFVVIDGKKRPVPEYYIRKLERDDPAMYADVREARREKARAHAENNTPERLRVREECHKLKLRRLRRELDDQT
jgi:hypothetical protein